MSFVILCAFVAFFVYLGSRLWKRPSDAHPQMAGGGLTANPMSGATGDVSYRNTDSNRAHEMQPRSPVGSATRGTTGGMADTSDSVA